MGRWGVATAVLLAWGHLGGLLGNLLYQGTDMLVCVRV